jgi:hypothetical protein
MQIKYRDWAITTAYHNFVATHDRNHDESGNWQINGNSVEEIKAEIDEREDS